MIVKTLMVLVTLMWIAGMTLMTCGGIVQVRHDNPGALFSDSVGMAETSSAITAGLFCPTVPYAIAMVGLCVAYFVLPE